MLIPKRRSLIIKLILIIISSIFLVLITPRELLITSNLGESLHFSPIDAVVILLLFVWNVLRCRNRRELKGGILKKLNLVRKNLLIVNDIPSLFIGRVVLLVDGNVDAQESALPQR
jgi:hypothetical protein